MLILAWIYAQKSLLLSAYSFDILYILRDQDFYKSKKKQKHTLKYTSLNNYAIYITKQKNTQISFQILKGLYNITHTGKIDRLHAKVF